VPPRIVPSSTPHHLHLQGNSIHESEVHRHQRCELGHCNFVLHLTGFRTSNGQQSSRLYHRAFAGEEQAATTTAPSAT